MAPNADYERALYSRGYNCVCGVDEVGCGSLMGDVYMAAVILPKDLDLRLLKGLNDSKKLDQAKREALYPLIKQYASAWAIGIATVDEIDEHNIYWAKWIAARRALKSLATQPDYILMDGDKAIPEVTIPQTAIIKGDGKSVSIAAASILAKVDRDRYVVDLAKNVSTEYGWVENKGYYTEGHVEALKKHGKTVYHRTKYVSKFIGGASEEFSW
jgi:ribonuclease HII